MLLLEELRILHGYLATGILPDRIALSVLISAILGSSVKIPDHIVIDAFMDYLSSIERATLKSEVSFQPTVLNDLITTLSRFGCRCHPWLCRLLTMNSV